MRSHQKALKGKSGPVTYAEIFRVLAWAAVQEHRKERETFVAHEQVRKVQASHPPRAICDASELRFLLKVGSVVDLSLVTDPPVPLCPSFSAASSFHGVPLLSFSSDPIFIEWKTRVQE